MYSYHKTFPTIAKLCIATAMLTVAANLNKLHYDDTKSIAIKNGEETKNYKKLCESKGYREYEHRRETLGRKGQKSSWTLRKVHFVMITYDRIICTMHLLPWCMHQQCFNRQEHKRQELNIDHNSCGAEHCDVKKHIAVC